MSSRRNHTGISQSAISIFRGCPHAYFLKYKLRCDPMFWTMEHMDSGKYGHDAIDKYYKLYFDPEEDKDYILYSTYSTLEKIWDRSLSVDSFKKIYHCLEVHANWEYSNITNGLTTKPYSELKLEHGGFYGIVDYIHPTNMKPIDWKTGKYASLRYEYMMQAYVYKVLLEGEFNISIPHFYFFFLYPDEWRTVKYDTDKMRKVGEDVEKMKNAILEEKFEQKPRTPSVCKNCEFKYYCKILGM